MKRIKITPRPNWREIVSGQGLTYHTSPQGAYWNESAYYRFGLPQALEIERATNDLAWMALIAVGHVIKNRRYAELGIPEQAIPLIEYSWEYEDPSIYGRFDLAYDGKNPPKMLEYNADTPTSLVEASVVQWLWREELFPGADQFTSIHERLIEKWRELEGYLKPGAVHFAHQGEAEDAMTIAYLMDTAQQAGLTTIELPMSEIAWNNVDEVYVDRADKPINNLFKLYPWEWLVHEKFAEHLPTTLTKMFWIEPAWKMVLSNKGILAIMWELFPNHPNLLPAYLGGPREMKEYVKKPLLSREGANVTIVTPGATHISPGEYGEEGHVYQAFYPIPDLEGNHPVIGSWVIDHAAAGMGIRESDGLITDNTSRFVPHIID